MSKPLSDTDQTTPEAISDEECPGCGHSIDDCHFTNVRGVVRCTNVDSGTSSRGVIGIPYSHRCDCKNYVSESVQREREEEAAKELRWKEAFKERLQR